MSRRIRRGWPWLLLLALLACGSAAAQDRVRAWLDRDRIAFGETATLNVETTGPGVDVPDWTPLDRNFETSGHTSRRQVELVNGRRSERTLYAVALRPRREGVLTVPALRLGNATTAPLQLSVAPARIAAAHDGAPAFIESEVDAQSPYVQQAVGYTLRLYYAAQLVSGQLDQPLPDGATLQRVGSDVQYQRDIGGTRYQVLERRFLLVPERSGPLTVPGARFEGRGIGGGGMFGDMLDRSPFSRGPRRLDANGPPSVLDVQPIPAGAPQPWLPLYGVDGRWLDAPDTAGVGQATTLVAEVRYDGSTAAPLPELVLPDVDGAQVFPEPAEFDETFDNGRPQVLLRRRFSIVPSHAGPLRIAGPRIDWWDARAGIARTTALPMVTLDVAPGSGSADMPAVDTRPAARGPDSVAADAGGGAWRGGRIALPVLACIPLLVAGLWLWAGLRRRRPTAMPSVAADAAASSPYSPTSPPVAPHRALLQLLQTGGQDEVSAALRALTSPPAPSIDALRARLRDPQQRAALDQWQQARWAGGDVVAARARLRAAFRDGADLAAAAAPVLQAGLPPLYPQR
ncbi:BatD family protein [Luteimonas sp. BDR2-5]|uniref:BatD family protein n=1 Tax=Proluteimonas luteida TaxID=2878685 RepID=UPI001E5DDB08|nr:BatD family protein [Luteimonas sp. BDR2-5]MCD9026997.1 BatD family protein [Luteimonas sp. BDR2-5]